MTKLRFSKMHGLGNCFILMDDRAEHISSQIDVTKLAVAICDRNFGIGADGLILVKESTGADLRMQIFNEDGSEPEMCGNGVRCFARYAIDENITSSTTLNIETLAGIIKTSASPNGTVEVDMGEPILKNQDILVKGEGPIVATVNDLDFTYVSMGNPHAITFVNNFDLDWRKIGENVERNALFPNRTNVEFVKIVSPNKAKMKVWERGCGETLACGTGACAVAVAGAIRGKLSRESVNIQLPGGNLSIEWNAENRVMMTGEAVLVCQGEYFYPNR